MNILCPIISEIKIVIKSYIKNMQSVIPLMEGLLFYSQITY